MSELAKRIWALTALLCLGIGPAEFPVTAYSGIGHPEHFYEGKVDFSWQKRQQAKEGLK